MKPGEQVLARIDEFRALTQPDPDSDMNRLLRALSEGRDPLIAVALAEYQDRIIGWATVERFRHLHLINVFVAPTYRRLHVGRGLVRDVLEEVRRERPDISELLNTGEPPGFWKHFPEIGDIKNVSRRTR